MNISMLNGDAHHSLVWEVEPRIWPLLNCQRRSNPKTERPKSQIEKLVLDQAKPQNRTNQSHKNGPYHQRTYAFLCSSMCCLCTLLLAPDGPGVTHTTLRNYLHLVSTGRKIVGQPEYHLPEICVRNSNERFGTEVLIDVV